MKLYVDLLQTITTAGPNHGKQRIRLRVIWDGKKITFQNRRGYDGIFSICGLHGREYTPKDGLEYLEALQYQYSGSYLNATAPKRLREGDE